MRTLLTIAILAVAIPTAAQTAPAPAEMSAVLEATTQNVAPSVVEIFTTAFQPGNPIVPRRSDLVTTQRGSGSGVIVDGSGFILTNAHVVAGAYRVRVELPPTSAGESILGARGQALDAAVVGIDLETDLAVLRVERTGLRALSFGDSDALRPGQLVLAVGSPLGLNNSVSLGVVSSPARQLEPESPMIYVQTDASINPGSSGGPLVDVAGRIVGINTLIFSQSGGYEGIAFAAPSNIARTVYEQIKMFGRVRRGDIGARAQTITPELAAGLALSQNHGVVLSDILPGSAAEVGGLRAGDIVLAADAKPMENGRQFQVNLYRRVVGEVVSLDVARGTERLRFTVALRERRDPVAALGDKVDPRANLISRLGILGISVDRNVVEVLPGVRMKAGVLVASVVKGAIDARDGGLEAGDIVFAVNRTPVPALADLRAVVDALKPGETAVLHVERRGERLYVPFGVE